MWIMLIFSPEGPRSFDPAAVVAINRGGGDGRHTYAVLVMGDGTEVSGAVANEALARLEDELADMPLSAA